MSKLPRYTRAPDAPIGEPENRSGSGRDEHGRFAKGASGNPGGRPRVAVHVCELARQATTLAIETLIEVCKSGDNDRARVAAAVALLDRGWGKAPAEIQVSGGLSLEQRIRAMTPAQREKRIKDLEALRNERAARMAERTEGGRP